MKDKIDREKQFNETFHKNELNQSLNKTKVER